MANNTYKFPSGGINSLGLAWQLAFTVDPEFDAAIVTSCLVTNTSALQDDVAVSVAVYDESSNFERYWARSTTIPFGSQVNIVDGYQNLPTGWSVRAQAAVSGAIDLSVSAIGVTYG